FGSCPMNTVRAIPLRYPIRIGFDSRSGSRPSRRTPNAMQNAPEIRARPAARLVVRVGSPSASGATVAAMSAASDESGPTTRIRLGPQTAYNSRGTNGDYTPLGGVVEGS